MTRWMPVWCDHRKGPQLAMVVELPCLGVASFRPKEERPKKEIDMTEDQVQQSADCCYLIIVRYDPDCDAWVVDEDSRHILEERDGGGVTPQELQVLTLRSLPQSVPW